MYKPAEGEGSCGNNGWLSRFIAAEPSSTLWTYWCVDVRGKIDRVVGGLTTGWRNILPTFRAWPNYQRFTPHAEGAPHDSTIVLHSSLVSQQTSLTYLAKSRTSHIPWFLKLHHRDKQYLSYTLTH